MRISLKKSFAFFFISYTVLIIVLGSVFFSVYNLPFYSRLFGVVEGKAHCRVAVLLFRKRYDNRVNRAVQLIRSARKSLRLANDSSCCDGNSSAAPRPIKVTYFLFIGVNEPMPITGDFAESLVVIRLPRKKTPECADSPKQKVNPCESFMAVEPRFGFFNPNMFEFVLAIEASVKLRGEIPFATLLTKQLAVLQHAFPNVLRPRLFVSQKYGTKEDFSAFGTTSLLHYSSSVFGGATSQVKTMCLLISNSSKFHQSINEYLHGNLPTTVLGPHGPKNVKQVLRELIDFQQMTENLFLPPSSWEEKQYYKVLQSDSEHRQNVLRQMAINRIADAIRRNYVNQVHKFYPRTHPEQSNATDQNSPTHLSAKFVTSICTNEVTVDCGGFGDRLRGLAVAFYMAIATNRVFHVNQNKPIDLAKYFQINDKLYDVPQEAYEANRKLTVNNSVLLQRMDVGSDFVRFLDGEPFEVLLFNYSNIGLVSNRYAGLASLLRNKKFSSLIDGVAEYESDSRDYGIFDYPIFISAAFRVVLGRMANKLQQFYDLAIASTVGFDVWENSVKIGVQIRTEDKANFARDPDARVEPRQILCFARKVRQVIKEKVKRSTYFSNRPHIVIFVTSDWADAIDIFREHLTDVGKLRFFYTGKKQNLTITHIDQTNETNHWQVVAKTYLDWVLLTKMDFLVISRSGFGETASMMSLKPTWRFYDHERHLKCGQFQEYNILLRDVTIDEGYPIEALKRR